MMQTFAVLGVNVERHCTAALINNAPVAQGTGLRNTMAW
jgi:hypothetical protein